MNRALSVSHLDRLAGLAYLVMIVSAAGGYATMTKLLDGAPEVVTTRVAGSGAFDIAFAAMALGFISWMVLVVMLYRLIGAYSRTAGALMVVFTLAGAVVNLTALGYLLPIVGSSPATLEAGSLGSMRQSYEHLLVLAQVFSGLWMFPFGLLILRSGAVPKLFGYCLIIGGIGYLFIPLTNFAPGLDQNTAYWVISRIPGVPAMVGEIGVCLWLLIKGAKHLDSQQGSRAT